MLREKPNHEPTRGSPKAAHGSPETGQASRQGDSQRAEGTAQRGAVQQMNQGSRRPHLGKWRQRPTHGSTDAALGGHRAGQPRERLQKQGRTAHATRIAGRRATRAKNQKANGSGGRTNAGQKGQKAKAAEQRGCPRARVHCTERAGQGRPAPTTGGRRAKRRKGIKPNKLKSGSTPRMRTEKGSPLS